MKATSLDEDEAPSRFDYDANFQVRIIRTLYQDPDYCIAVGAYLEASHFEKKSHRWVANELITYAKKQDHGASREALLIGMRRALRMGRLTKEAIPEIRAIIKKLDRNVTDKSFIKEELFRFVKQRATERAILNSLDYIKNQDFDAIDREFSRVVEVQEAASGGLGHFYVRDVKDRSKKRKEHERNGVSTGLKIDDYLKPGGLPPKALGVVVAATGAGKSHFLVHIGKSAILDSNAKVLHVTLELSEDTILDRYDAAFSGIPINKLETHDDQVEQIVKEQGERYGEFLVVKEFAPATLTAAALRSYIRQLERVAFYPTLIVLDYADEMIPSRTSRDNDQYEDMGSVYRELRKLAFELKVPVWTASQAQRTALNKQTIDLNNISDSFKKMMIADLVLMMAQTTEEKQKKVARLFVGKNRFGTDKFDIPIRIDWARSTIKSGG